MELSRKVRAPEEAHNHQILHCHSSSSSSSSTNDSTLLLQISEKRVSRYEKWKAGNEVVVYVYKLINNQTLSDHRNTSVE
jgi:hypothetical protein